MAKLNEAVGAAILAAIVLAGVGCAAPAAQPATVTPAKTAGAPPSTPASPATPTAPTGAVERATPTARQATPTDTAVPTRAALPATRAPGSDPAPMATPGGSSGAAPTAAPTMPSQADALLERAKQDAARRAGVPTSEVVVVKAETVQWSDSSLGCPEPGKVYLQVITPGYRFVLRAGGKQYEYHIDRGGQVIYCPNP